MNFVATVVARILVKILVRHKETSSETALSPMREELEVEESTGASLI